MLIKRGGVVFRSQAKKWASRSAWYDRHVGIVEVAGSNPASSTKHLSFHFIAKGFLYINQYRRTCALIMSGNIRRCTNCGENAQYVYTAKFRSGGTSGGIKLLIGEWGELGEAMIPMYVFVCPNCGKVELYATEDLRQQAIRASRENP